MLAAKVLVASDPACAGASSLAAISAAPAAEASFTKCTSLPAAFDDPDIDMFGSIGRSGVA
jgi:hypothetical protein